MKKLQSFAQKLTSLSGIKKRIIAITNDAVICLVSIVISIALRTGEWPTSGILIGRIFIISILIWWVAAGIYGVYRTIFRFIGANTIYTLARAILLYTLPFSSLLTIITINEVPRTVGFIQPIVFGMILIANRVSVRYFLTDIVRDKAAMKDIHRLIIYGAGSSGRQLAISFKQEPNFFTVAFVDDDHALDGRVLDGVKVHHSSKIESIIHRFDVTDIVLAMPRNSREINRSIVRSLERFSVRVKTIPPITDLVNGRVSADIVRDINVEDLLGRDPVPPNDDLLQKTVLNKVVLVTGAGGSIGGELCKQILKLRPKSLILVEMAEYALYKIEQEILASEAILQDGRAVNIVPELVNISDQLVVRRLFERWRPDTVFHAAAYKHVPLVEHNPIGGMRNNIFGTLFCAQAAEEYGVTDFILISTDKAVRPTNVMGATKRVCELILQALTHNGSSTKFVMVRFGNVLGSSGSVVPRFEQQIRSGGPVTITDRRITRYFMTIPEAAQLVIQAGALAQPGEVCVLDMGKSIQIFDLATAMVKLSGLTVKSDDNPSGDIEIVEVGLRPGEKLYEELLIGTNPTPTSHERIFKANEPFIPYHILENVLGQLQHNILSGDAVAAINCLAEIVPEYVRFSRIQH